MKWSLENCVFAWQPTGGQTASLSNPIAKTHRITLATDSAVPIGIEVVAGPKADVHLLDDRESGCCAYLWGNAVHPHHKAERLIRWIIEQVRAERTEPLAEVLGMFILLVDDRSAQRVYIVSDPLGVRPWLIGYHLGRFVCGSSIWPIAQARLSQLQVNYDALASWLYYGYDLTGGSLFTDYRRLAPGAVTIIHAGEITEKPYARITAGNALPPRQDIADFIFHTVSDSFDLLTEGLDRVTVGLSGGYDSRLLAAIAAKKKDLQSELMIVREWDAEVQVASRVSEAIGLPLRVIPTDGSLWNMFGDDPFGALPEGFPITRQLVHVVAAQRPGVPVVNGYMGDILVRGTGTPEDRAVEFEPDQTLVPSLTRRRRLPGLRFDLLEPSIEGRVEARAREAMHALIRRGREFGKPFLYSGLYGRQRCYVSNNLIQHLDLSRTIAPFYSWSLINARFANDYDCFWWQTYELLFARHFPKLARIRHAARGAGVILHRPTPTPSRCTRRWAARLLASLARPEFLPILSRKKAVTRLAGAVIGRSDVADAVLFLQRLHLLESRLRHANTSVNWRLL